VDIQAIKARLESDGQVAAATISRRFPSTLVVSLNERTPVARLVTRGEDGRAVVYLAAVDGFLYRGYGYDPGLIARIPFLDGIRLVRRGEGFAPISRLDDVASLFALGEQIAPHLVEQWRIVALDRRPFIVVRTREVPEIIFEPGSYRHQLARLDYILDFYRRSPGETPARIDLSFKNQAAVELAAGDLSRNPQHVYPEN
jgi:cell division protein FtsQ